MITQQYVKYNFGEQCICVGRVSTSSQSQTAQTRDLEEYARVRGFKNIKTFFTTESGFLEYDEKQGWNLVTDYLEKNPTCRVLICSELSRLSRKKSILDKIEEYLVEHKIQLIVKDIGFSLFDEFGQLTPGNEIIFTLYASLANSEMQQKKERFSRSLRDNRQLGFSIGGKELFGYNRIYVQKDGRDRSKYEINEKEAEEIRAIYRWYAFGIDGDLQNTTILSITKECIERGFSAYLHSKRNVNKCLKERAYCGQKETHNKSKNPAYWNYKKADEPKYVESNSYICTYPPIFTGDESALFDIVQSRMRQNNTRYTKTEENILDRSRSHTSILAKLIKCPICGTYLHGEYRNRSHSQRQHLDKRCYYVYRCNYSRGAIHTCSFKRSISMPLIDSVVWAYCKNTAFQMITTESSVDINTRVAEIDEKIYNIQSKIQEFDIESRINSEAAILRAKTRVLRDTAMIESAVAEYDSHVTQIEKELNYYKKRKIELEQEKEAIRSSVSFLDSIKKYKEIDSSKKLLYKHIHRVVKSVEIIAWDKYHLVLKVHFKKATPYYRNNQYICIYSKTTKFINAFVVNSYDIKTKELLYKQLHMSRPDSIGEKRNSDFILDHLPSTDKLYWDKIDGKFRVDEYSFTLDEMRDFYEYPEIVIDPVNPRPGATLVGAPVQIKKMDVERLTCYEEDSRDKN